MLDEKTEKELGILNDKMRISVPSNTVRVMDLIRIHKPKSKKELAKLIELHHTHKCSCGIRSKGTIQDFGKALYSAQSFYWGEYRYTLQQCIEWEYEIFTTKSLTGDNKEKKACEELNQAYPQYRFEEADVLTDLEHRVDILVYDGDQLIGGVQVKPDSYKGAIPEFRQANAEANERWGKPVFYLYYNDGDLQFNNMHEFSLETAQIS